MTASIETVARIQHAFQPLIGSQLVRYQTAELLHDDGSWSNWPDLPIRLYAERETMVSVSWSQFDDLWLANNVSLPFVAEDDTTRWIENGIVELNPCLGRSFRGVSLGQGQMTMEEKPVEIWTQLLIDFGDCWLEIFNALDENGYALHYRLPAGEFVQCI